MNNFTLAAKAQYGTQLRNELLELSVSATAHFFRLGEIMKEIRDKKLWADLGYHTFEAFFSDPELAYHKSSVYHAIHLVEVFPDWQDKTNIAVSKLILIAPHVKEENKEELVEKARGLSKSDLEHELITSGMSKHNPQQGGILPKIYNCRNCQGIKGVTFDLLCHCGWTKQQIEFISRAIEKIEFGDGSAPELEDDEDLEGEEDDLDDR